MYLDGRLNLRNQWARQHAANGVREEWNKLVERSLPQEEWDKYRMTRSSDPLPDPSGLISRMSTSLPAFTARFLPALPSQASVQLAHSTSPGVSHHKTTSFTVGIVGAGAAGLFTGLILDYLNSKVDRFNASYDILEANAKDRVGGRLYTHNFDDGEH